MKYFVLIAALLMSAPVFGALPGVTELKMPPEKIPDAELSALLDERVAAADVIAIGETVHGSSAFLKSCTSGKAGGLNCEPLKAVWPATPACVLLEHL